MEAAREGVRRLLHAGARSGGPRASVLARAVAAAGADEVDAGGCGESREGVRPWTSPGGPGTGGVAA